MKRPITFSMFRTTFLKLHFYENPIIFGVFRTTCLKFNFYEKTY
jgi:hypothetical protein